MNSIKVKLPKCFRCGIAKFEAMKIVDDIDFKSENDFYILTCPECKKIYSVLADEFEAENW